ncbi:MAG: type I-E CRISPR-associated protein Cas6/Cse3/CasE [Armatimonadetes bacterium]|jgi:CRISPR system Cascade subunit CasE|nr:type I-E CRISPR-associated protein Cas6/Cse3/CasE [Armatimonadota bacterium]
MYISLLELNPRSRQVQSELRDPYQMHRTLSRAFGDDRSKYVEARCLFRVDEDESPRRLNVLVQTKTYPDWDSAGLPENYLTRSPQTKELNPVFRNGQLLQFRLRANPTVKRNGKRLGLYAEEEQTNWLLRKAECGGFKVLHVVLKSAGKRKATTNDKTATFVAVIFEGVLRVTDADKFAQTLVSGIGSAKAFGFGLLSIAPAEG